MASNVRDVSNPPREYFSVWQRLFRGYGPLAALSIVLLLTALLVPSKAQDAQKVSANGNASGGGLSRGTTASTAPGASGTAGGSAAGAGGAAGGGGDTGAGQTGAVPGAGVADCAGDQVQGDPYSPPCKTFSGDNGGATSTGVTASEIRMSFRVLNEKGFQQTLAALAGASLVDTPDSVRNTITTLAEYFNKNYQFYGRKLVFNFYNGTGSNTDELLGKGREKAEADATTVQSMGVFGDMSGTSEPYAGALAKRGVMAFGTPYLSQKWHQERAPYAWSIATDGTKVAKFAAEYASKKLCTPGAKAEFAGGALKQKDRLIATFAPENSWYKESVQVARNDLGGCNLYSAPGSPDGGVYYQLDLGTMSNQAQNLIPAMKNAGVTTILCGCDPIIPVFLSGVANSQNYFPEFIIVGTALTDTDIVGQLWDQNFTSHAFGVSSLTEPVPSTQTLGYAAFKTINPSAEPAFSVDLIYYQMAQLAIGIQMAGPNLTPQTFEQGMFAYPPKLGPAGTWGFGPGDYTTSDDVREIYWDRNAISNYNQKQGAFKETDGQRFTQGNVPAGRPNVPVNP